MRATGNLRPADLGLTSRRLGYNLLLGLGGVVLLAPLVYAVQLPAEWLFRQLSGPIVRDHDLTLLARHGPD